MVQNGTEWYRMVRNGTEPVCHIKKESDFSDSFLYTVLLIRKEALNNDSERYYVQVYCTPPINTFQEHLFYY